MPFSIRCNQNTIFPYTNAVEITTRIRFTDGLNSILNTAKQARICPANFPSATEMLHQSYPSAVAIIPVDSQLSGMRPMMTSLTSGRETWPETPSGRNQHQCLDADMLFQSQSEDQGYRDNEGFYCSAYINAPDIDAAGGKWNLSGRSPRVVCLPGAESLQEAAEKQLSLWLRYMCNPCCKNISRGVNSFSTEYHERENYTAVTYGKPLTNKLMAKLTAEQMQFIRGIVADQNIFCDTTVMRKSGEVPSLNISAATAFSKAVEYNHPLRTPADLQAVMKYFADSCPLPATLQKDLKHRYCGRLRQITFHDSKTLAVAVAIARITDPARPENCDQIALAHGIGVNTNIMAELRMIAAEGPAAERVRSGVSCAVAGGEFGIPANSPAMERLYAIAIEGPAGNRVLNGESCTVVRRSFDLPESGGVMDKLYEIAARGPAGEEIRAGRSCAVVAREFGIPDYIEARKALYEIAIKGPAGERVRNGESCAVVAREFGIPDYVEARKALYEIAINGPAGERVRNGESPEAVARALGIPLYRDLIEGLYMIAENQKT